MGKTKKGYVRQTRKVFSVAELDKSIRDLVKFRLNAVPKDLQISIGSRYYSKEELIESIDNNSELGQQIIEIQLDYLRDLASGKISELISDEQVDFNNQTK